MSALRVIEFRIFSIEYKHNSCEQLCPIPLQRSRSTRDPHVPSALPHSAVGTLPGTQIFLVQYCTMRWALYRHERSRKYTCGRGFVSYSLFFCN